MQTSGIGKRGHPMPEKAAYNSSRSGCVEDACSSCYSPFQRSKWICKTISNYIGVTNHMSLTLSIAAAACICGMETVKGKIINNYISINYKKYFYEVQNRKPQLLATCMYRTE